MEEKISFGKFIMKKRKEKNLTQRQLAESLFVTESAVSKWERGISYPDISLVTNICEILEISEHELITASEDLQQRELEKQASKFQKLVKTYEWVFYIIYGITLLTCFICNIAIFHTLSWFFIVLTAVAVAFSLTLLPVLVKQNKGLWTLGAFYITLNLLIMTCCIYTKGDWFGICFAAILFSFVLVFMPFVLKEVQLPRSITSHKALLCISIDTVFLFGLIIVCNIYIPSMGNLFTNCLITLFSITLPWMLVLTIRYIRVNALFKTAICLLESGVFVLFQNSVLESLINHVPFALMPTDLSNWSYTYLNGNIILVIVLVLIILAIFFIVGGINLVINKSKGENINGETNEN